MPSRWIQEYSIQTMLAALQATVIVIGVMTTGAVLKFRGYPEIELRIPNDVWFVRFWGWALLIVPCVWVFATIWFEERRDNEFSKASSIVTGAAVLIVLAVFLSWTTINAGTCRIGTLQLAE